MTSSYPDGIDTFTIPPGTQTLGGSTPKHTVSHQALADAVVAIEETLGVNPTRAYPGAVFAVTGDSITAQDSTQSTQSHGNSWATHCALASNGALRLAYNGGHGGYNSTQLLALLDSEPLSVSPNVVGILWGTNDSLDGSNQPATTAANTRSAVAKIRAAGALPFLCTIPPQGTAAISAPAAPTLTPLTTGGTIGTDTLYYKLTYTNDRGETTTGPSASTSVTGPNGSVLVDVPFVEGMTGAKVYVSDDDATFHLIGTLTGGSTGKCPQRYTDTTGALTGAAPPGANTTGNAWNSTAQRKIKTINAWIRNYGRAAGVPVVDVHALLVDPTTGMYQTGWTVDGTHPTQPRSKVIGDAVWTAISKIIPPMVAQVTMDNADPINLYTNGCLINGSGSLPTSWTSYGGSSSDFTDTLGTKTGFLGKALQCTRSIPDVRFHDSPNISTGFSVGDVIDAAFVIQTENCLAGGGNVMLTFRANGSSADLGQLILSAVDVGPSVWMVRFTIPSGTTSFYIKGPYLAYGTQTVSIGQITFYNVTTGGLLL